MKYEIIYYSILLALSIASIIAAIVKGQGSAKKDKLIQLANIIQTIPSLIEKAEQMFPSGQEKTGTQKLSYILKELEVQCVKQNIKFDEEFFKSEIEKILSTPEKKGEKNEKTQNSI